MDDSKDIQTSPFDHDSRKLKRWTAQLSLQYHHEAKRSYLAKKWHHGPLVIQKSLYPEGGDVCHGVVIHPPGGVAGGDVLALDVHMHADAKALLTTPGAGKWYKASSKVASQKLRFNLQEGASLEWFPQENILFNEARVNMRTHVTLEDDARFAGWDIVCFGRQARQERWEQGVLHQQLTIERRGVCIWYENGRIAPDSKVFHAVSGLKGNPVSGSFVVASGHMPSELIEACKGVQPKLILDKQAQFGVTALSDIVSARYVGASSQEAKDFFMQLWQILRPWYLGREAVKPRIWNT